MRHSVKCLAPTDVSSIISLGFNDRAIFDVTAQIIKLHCIDATGEARIMVRGPPGDFAAFDR